MEYIKLGLTDLLISRIGFGCWAIGGHGYGIVNDETSISAVEKAVDLGINFFDTADVYGFGHSEEILSRALGPARNKVIIATKFGVCWDESGRTYKDCSPNKIIEALEGSLRRLRIDCIPLYQIHRHDDKTSLDDIMDTLLRCRDEGKIQYIGCCNLSEKMILQMHQKGRVESYQCLYNVLKKENDNIMKVAHDELSMSIFIYGVLGRGIFSGKFNSDTKFGEKDTRSSDIDFQNDTFLKNLRISEKLRDIGMRYGKTPSQVAIRWAFDNPYISSVITGIKNADQITQNIGAIGWSLELDDIDIINSLSQLFA